MKNGSEFKIGQRVTVRGDNLETFEGIVIDKCDTFLRVFRECKKEQHGIDEWLPIWVENKLWIT